MKPIEGKERYTLSKIVSDNLRDYIVQNELKTGDKLPSERDLSTKLDVSRVIVREALRSLESAGIVSIRHGEGAFVNTDDASVLFSNLLFFWQMRQDKMEEILELRKLLEGEAIRGIIDRSDELHLAQLEEINRRMERATETAIFQELDLEFHKTLIQATNNDLFIQLADIIVHYFTVVSTNNMDISDRKKALKEHHLMMEALRNKDREWALQILYEHLEYPRKNLAAK